MKNKLLGGILGVLALFLGFVAFQPSDFHIAREIKINAPAEAVFAYVNDLHKFDAWSPWSKIDPKAKYSFEGPLIGVGASLSWEGNNQVGAGRMTIIDSNPNTLVRMKLEYFKPFSGTSTSEFTLKTEGGQTLISWSNSGKKTFMSRIYCIFMNLDKTVGSMFEKGLNQLKTMVEAETKT